MEICNNVSVSCKRKVYVTHYLVCREEAAGGNGVLKQKSEKSD